MAKDNTVAIADQHWKLEKSRFRSSLACCTVTIHEHLDGAASIRYGPHVVGRSRHSRCPARPDNWPFGLVEGVWALVAAGGMSEQPGEATLDRARRMEEHN